MSICTIIGTCVIYNASRVLFKNIFKPIIPNKLSELYKKDVFY